MKNLLCLVLTWVAFIPLDLSAETAVTRYWPMNDGDIKYYSGTGGSSYLEFTQDFFGDGFDLNIYQKDPGDDEYFNEGSATYRYSDASDILFNDAQEAFGTTAYFEPPWRLLDNNLLTSGGTKKASLIASVPDITNIVVSVTVSVKSAGTVTVPAGTYRDCRQVNLNVKVAGGGVSGQAFVLAPNVGIIRVGIVNSRLKVVGWQDMTNGSVGGVDVKDLANQMSTSPLSMQINGTGTVTPSYNGQSLEIGKTYSMTANAGSGSIFAGWSGDISSENTKLTFVMQSNLELQANFIPNPFIPVTGNYQGLFYDTNGSSHQSSGYFSAKTTSKGTFTAKLTLAAKNYSMSGQFSGTGAYSGFLTRKGMSALSVQLQLDLAGDERLTGSISDGTWTADLTADRAVYSKTSPAPQAGKYTLIIPGSEDASAEPGGTGFGAVTVDGLGNVTFKGTLGDGTKVAQKAILSSRGQWPFYLSLYSGNGSIIGWLNFSNEPASDLKGWTSWSRFAQPSAKLYPAGFVHEAEVVGSSYRFMPGVRVLNIDTGEILLANGNLTGNISNVVTLGTDNKVVNQSANKLTITITTSSGLFKGSVTDPATGKPISFFGALLQKQNFGAGYFLGTGQSGQVYFGN